MIVRLQTYRKILFARDPLERVVSAFKDKFADVSVSGPIYREIFGPVIQRIYRSDLDQVSKSGLGTTFEEFARYIVDTSSYVEMDDHWATVTRLCQPCKLK